MDHTNRQIWFQAGGIVPGQDPYFIHFCRVNFDGTDLTDLTPATARTSHNFRPTANISWIPGRAWMRRRSQICAAAAMAASICPLETAEVVGKLPLPTPFVAKGRDGCDGYLWRTLVPEKLQST